MITLEMLNRRGTGFLPGYLGIVFTELTDEELHAEIAIQPHHIAPNGYLHAGTVITLLRDDSLLGQPAAAAAQLIGHLLGRTY